MCERVFFLNGIADLVYKKGSDLGSSSESEINIFKIMAAGESEGCGGCPDNNNNNSEDKEVNETTSPKNRVKFLCSHGGRILPRPPDGQLKYVGGETRVIAIPRDISFSGFL